MKISGGWITTSVITLIASVGVTALRPHPSSQALLVQEGAPKARASVAAPTKAGKHEAPAKPVSSANGCGAIVTLFRTFTPAFSTDGQFPSSCFASDAPKSTTTQNAASTLELRAVIATLPDPIHTHLQLMFDDDIQAIQQAAQEAGYTYDSSWLPWDTDSHTYDSLEDQEKSDGSAAIRQRQPGVLLFRHAVAEGDPSKPYDGLVVFIVGEEATQGIDQNQFNSAVAWIDSLRTRNLLNQHAPQILGPSFSGSFPSLARLLKTSLSSDAPLAGKNDELEIFSGQATNRNAVDWFKQQFSELKNPDGPSTTLSFFSFDQDDDTAIVQLHDYLNRAHFPASLAIISEDETTYGYGAKEKVQGAAPDPGARKFGYDRGPGDSTFFYPRDISAIRSAYQAQGVFNRANSSGTTEPQRILRTDLTDTESKISDTVRSYANSQAALDQEAALLQIVGMLKDRHFEFVLLRSTNPLDQLFLAHFFRMTYPEGRVIILGSDLLLRREVSTGGLTGIVTLTSYPPLAQLDEWTRIDGKERPQRAFTQNGAQGTYVALRALLRPAGCYFNDTEAFLPGYCDPPSSATGNNPPRSSYVPTGYSQPFWMRGPTISTRPLTWLSVLSSNGFSPLASLPDRKLSDYDPPSSGTWPPFPIGFRIFLIGIFLWALAHAFFLCSPALTVRPERRTYFARLTGRALAHSHRSHTALLVTGSVLIVIASVVLSWSYGWMALYDAPVKHPGQAIAYPFIIWAIASFALLFNTWIEYKLSLPVPSDRLRPGKLRRRDFFHWKELSRALHEARLSLLILSVCSIAFTFGFGWFIDHQLPRSVRTLTYIRAMNIEAGVSPAAPLLILAIGLYAWAWYSLRGLSLFGPDRPLLPPNSTLPITSLHGDPHPHNFFSMLSEESAAVELERFTDPFTRAVWYVSAAVFSGLVIGGWFIADHFPLHSLGLQYYANFVCLWIALNIALLIGGLWQIVLLWHKLRALLMFLDKLPLRRTLQAIHGFTWGSIWKMGGNALDIRYQLFYRQFESLNHFTVSLKDAAKATPATPGASACLQLVEDTQCHRTDFAEWYAQHWDDWQVRELSTIAKVQKDAATLAGTFLSKLLVPAWLEETKSLLTPSGGGEDAKDGEPIIPVSSKPHIQNAEEFVCLVYLGFIQNILGRVRSLVIGAIWLFLSIALILPSYPFDPRPVLVGAVLILFGIVAVTILIVLTQMFKDATLSHLTNTKPGELGSAFWMKLIGFGAGPIFGLLATTLPGISDTLLSWLQPTLSSLK